jgi:hypothetical protein
VAPTHASPNLRRRSGKPRRVHHSERLDEPGRQAAVWLRGNEPSPGCLCGQRQCGQWYPEVPGRTFPFTVGGLGAGGIGISKIEAKGEVYGLERLRDFPGAYIPGSLWLALGTTSTGDLWLKNGNGVIMRLVAKRQGLTPSSRVLARAPVRPAPPSRWRVRRERPDFSTAQPVHSQSSGGTLPRRDKP